MIVDSYLYFHITHIFANYKLPWADYLIFLSAYLNCYTWNLSVYAICILFCIYKNNKKNFLDLNIKHHC